MFSYVRCSNCKYFRLLSFFSLNSNQSFSSLRIVDINKNQSDGPTSVKGWVKALRKMKDTTFVDIDDGSTSNFLQVVIQKDKVPANLSFGSSVEVKGPLVLSQNNKVELVADEIRVVGECPIDAEYPFVPRKTYTDEYTRQYLQFRPRTRKFGSLLRIRHCVSSAIHNFFNDRKFFFVHTPILTANDCEGAGEVFYVIPDNDKIICDMTNPRMPKTETFFNGKAYLTVSGQLHLEVLARSLGQVYNFGPVFRAENSKSRLHLSEFYMIEAEVAFVCLLEDIIKLNESLIKSVTETVLNECAEDIQNYQNSTYQNLFDGLKHIVLSPFTIMTFKEAVEILKNNSASLKSKFHPEKPLNKEHELFLVKYNGEKPLFVINWPKSLKPFYMKTTPEEDSTVMAFDLLCPNVGEVCGGSLREDNFDRLKDSIVIQELQDKLSWYLQLRKFGNVPTGGFGLGFERYLQVLLAVPNIKDTIPFPRWPHNCEL